jgi:D-amino peptidase
MNIAILTDMEGVSGICRSAQVSHGEPLYEAGRRYLTWDVNACVAGCFDGGATSVLVRDGHSGRGDNIIWEDVDPRAVCHLGSGGSRTIYDDMDYDGMILLGFHAMAGTPEAVLEHTMSSSQWQNFWLNGRRCGEIGVNAFIAGENGVPTIMASGDDKACREAEEFVPGIVTACVKTGLACEGARLLSAKAAHALITERAADAVQKIGQIEPVKLSPPVTARLELVSRGALPLHGEKPYAKIVDGRTYEVTGKNVMEALWRL